MSDQDRNDEGQFEGTGVVNEAAEARAHAVHDPAGLYTSEEIAAGITAAGNIAREIMIATEALERERQGLQEQKDFYVGHGKEGMMPEDIADRLEEIDEELSQLQSPTHPSKVYTGDAVIPNPKLPNGELLYDTMSPEWADLVEMKNDYAKGDPGAIQALDEFFKARPDIAGFIGAHGTPRERTRAMLQVVQTIAGIRGRNNASADPHNSAWYGRPFEDFPSLTVFMKQMGYKGDISGLNEE